MRPSRLWIYRLITALLPETRLFGLKVQLLRWCGAQIGTNVRINSSARFAGNGQLIIGDDVWIGPGNHLSAVGSATLSIGSHCDLAPQVTLLTGTHMIRGGIDGHMAGPGCARSVSIGDGCWLCARSLILPGVSLAEQTIVAAGAVVTTTCTEPCVLLTGTPAKIAKRYPAP
ncbi:MAG: acyltransferase [Candidatus Spyradenecus sp.]